jgi:mRNA-degrading endonuclease RelE of RelBE toxin-antitoxin system
MTYNVFPTPDFKKFFKKLAKKHTSLKTDLQSLVQTLKEQPDTGINLGHGIHKIRMAITSKGKGKSGGSRVITYLVTEDKEVYLVYIYDKSQLENITIEQIVELLKKAGLIK